MRILEVERCAPGECPWFEPGESPLTRWVFDHCAFGKFTIRDDPKTFPKNCPLKKVKK